MFARIYHRFFAARVATPKQKYEVVAVLIKVLDDVLRESLPAFATVAAGEMGFDGKDVI